MSRLARWPSAILLAVLAGCSTTRLVVIDAASQEALPGALVDGYRCRPQARLASDFTWTPIDASRTNDTGSAASTNVLALNPRENEFRFVISKPGYQRAEALVFTDKTLIASPADDADWKPPGTDRKHPEGAIPSRNVTTIVAGEKIVIQLYRDREGPTAATEPVQ